MGNVLTKLNQTIRILINMVELGKAKKLKCNDCSEYFEEVKGKMTILRDENKLIWHFYCKNCLRSWRKRGLQNEGLSNIEINEIIKREYP